jgi:hypothetical protein
MKMRHTLFAPVVLAVFAAVFGGPLWWNGSPARAADVLSSVGVAVTGTVTGQPESVAFSGKAVVSSRVLDPTVVGGVAAVVLQINLTAVSGVGTSTKTKYVITGPEIPFRKFIGSDTLEITFPFYASGASPNTARTGVASFTLNYNLATGVLTSATGTITSPNF